MGYIRASFLGKEYSIPEDVLLYINLLEFTGNIKTRLINTFVRELKSEIQKGNVACVNDKDLASEIEQQVGKYIAMLTEHGIYDRTVNDYLRQNEGYKLISKVNAAALEEARRALKQQMSDWLEGYEGAIQKKDASVTGYHVCITTYYEADAAEQTGLNTEAIAAVIPPNEAESYRECTVNGLPAAIYQKDGRAYLCWTIIPELSCVIEYDPAVESEEDMLRMAESVPANQNQTVKP